MIVKQQVNKVFGDDQQLLKLAFESITESLLKDPFRLQSFFEYTMSLAYTSTTSRIVSDNGSHDGQPSMYGQRYLSPDYEADCKQVECFRNTILNESEKLYNKKVGEFINKTISEAAAYDKNEKQLMSDEKQSKGILLFGFTES
jgi:hypothetical protein